MTKASRHSCGRIPDGGIGNVPGILMNFNEQARGSPLAGLTDDFFLVGHATFGS